MLRFIKHSLTTIDGVSIFPLISLLIFVLFFIVISVMVWKMNKEEITELENIPFENKENIQNATNF
jgi:cytochrome c oxidase cbb3-type subunit 4